MTLVSVSWENVALLRCCFCELPCKTRANCLIYELFKFEHDNKEIEVFAAVALQMTEGLFVQLASR